MRILFTNDDGFDSKGLHAVADLFKGEHDIAVVAPSAQRSGYSHSVTLYPSVLRYSQVLGYDYPVFAVDGTPVDCVKVGISNLFLRPDLVVSGINQGQNLGTDILYSGTVAAAVDAASMGYRAIALSLHTDNAEDEVFFDCAEFFKKNFDALMDIDLPRGTCLNINYPKTIPKGVKIAGMCAFDTFVDVYNCGEGDVLNLKGYRDTAKVNENTDESFCRAGYITITPLTTDHTDYETLKKFKRERFKL